MTDHLHIHPQRFRDWLGRRPLTFAVYDNRTFLCYSHSLGKGVGSVAIDSRGATNPAKNLVAPSVA